MTRVDPGGRGRGVASWLMRWAGEENVQSARTNSEYARIFERPFMQLTGNA